MLKININLLNLRKVFQLIDREFVLEKSDKSYRHFIGFKSDFILSKVSCWVTAEIMHFVGVRGKINMQVLNRINTSFWGKKGHRTLKK